MAHSHFPQRKVLPACNHPDQSCTFNGTPVCRMCFEARKVTLDAEWARAKAAREACEECQQAEAVRQAEAAEKYANRRCAYCGAAPSESVDVSTHSNVYECGSCWDWRKLDGPAARHWNRVAKEFLSNVDFYDISTFMPDRVGLDRDEFTSLLGMVKQLVDKTDDMIESHTRRPKQAD